MVGRSLSHLFFVDDLVLFAQVEESQARGVNDELVGRLCHTLGFHKVQNLEKYLGVPLFHNRVTNNTLHFVVDNVRSKLKSWDARKLSLVRKATLA
ncbi:hypothetical protein J1N35_020894 [Gossypium stocksii]|uniref:Reverse transcriptase domain-containing protein n=1 Tax=Gossypium stocksii TaxID=47602 RepID=A0A9D3VDL3_9ROSI|nr:hypothetical protein J1N35_020894 [Gossypium stocksii]